MNIYDPYSSGDPDFSPKPASVAMEVATHTGKRLRVQGLCEKCETPTNWVVDVCGRVGAYWCGCDNTFKPPRAR